MKMEELFIEYFKNVYGNDIKIGITNNLDDYCINIKIEDNSDVYFITREFYYKDRFYNDSLKDKINKNFEAFVRKYKIAKLLI